MFYTGSFNTIKACEQFGKERVILSGNVVTMVT